VDKSDAGDLLMWGLVGLALYFVYQAVTGVTGAVGSAVSAAGNAVGSGVANFWLSLTGSPPIGITGTVMFPGGAESPLSNYPLKTDAAGNVYLQAGAGNQVYQLQPWTYDAAGNVVYPAVAVSS
jgi:hypothetical protein